MDVYKTPTSNLDLKKEQRYQPIKGLIIGLLISVVLSYLISIVIFVAFALKNDLLMSNENSLKDLLSNTPYLITDLCVNSLVFYIAGFAACKYTPNKEIKFSLILVFINLIIYLLITISSEDKTPVWYNIMALLTMFGAVYLGASSRIKRNRSNE